MTSFLMTSHHPISSVARAVRFQQAQYTFGEGVGNATVMIVMNGASAVDVTINVRTIAGSATGMISISVLLTTSSCHMFCSTNGLHCS